jgi:Protein of unknown function (DUF1329)
MQPCGKGAVLLGLIVALVAPANGESPPPARIIDRTNLATVRELLPSSVAHWVESGDLTLVLGEMQDEVAWEPAFRDASEANAGHYGIDPEGGLIDLKTGKRPPQTYGLPFPHIDPNDPAAGVEVMWDTTSVTYKFESLRTPFALHWIGRSGFERLVTGQALSFGYAFRKDPLPNPDATESRDVFEALGPASVNGIATLTWRYLDNRPDSVWGYTPSIRRVRQLTAANRSDPSYGSDLTEDDGLLWLGKNQSFTWKLVGSRDVLVPAVVTHYVPLVAGARWEGGQEWISPASFPGATFGWEDLDWKGAPWMPTNMTWVRRPVWLVEGHPKDPYYSYGRQIFYIDRSTFKIYYKVIYTPAGEYWKTLVNDLGIGTTPDGSQREVITAAIVAVDDRAQHATYTRGNAPDFLVEYNSARARPELFTVGGLLRLGK